MPRGKNGDTERNQGYGDVEDPASSGRARRPIGGEGRVEQPPRDAVEQRQRPLLCGGHFAMRLIG